LEIDHQEFIEECASRCQALEETLKILRRATVFSNGMEISKDVVQDIEREIAELRMAIQK
jgi:hypothetical protein